MPRPEKKRPRRPAEQDADELPQRPVMIGPPRAGEVPTAFATQVHASPMVPPDVTFLGTFVPPPRPRS